MNMGAGCSAVAAPITFILVCQQTTSYGQPQLLWRDAAQRRASRPHLPVLVRIGLRCTRA